MGCLLKRIKNLPKRMVRFTCVLTMIISVAGIVALAGFLVINPIIIKPIAVLIQAIGSCVLIIPIMWGLNNYTKSRRGESAQKMANDDRISELEREIEGLENTISHIENASFNLQQFERIQELGLVKTKLQMIDLNKIKIGDTHIGKLPIPNTKYEEEYLGVITYNLTAKFGVDLKKIRFCNSSDGKNDILVFGIEPEYQGTMDRNSSIDVSEVRRRYLDGKGNLIKTEIDNSSVGRNTAEKQSKNMNRTFENKLKQGLKMDFMNEAVVKFAQDFIIMILAPLGRGIRFAEPQGRGSLPLADFLEKEKRINRELLEDKRALLAAKNTFEP